jgi:hypothetical protein
VTKTVGSGVTITDAINGEITVTLSVADQANLEQKRYYHSTDVVDAATDTSRPTVGFIDFQA